jgi:hypothetical protein
MVSILKSLKSMAIGAFSCCLRLNTTTLSALLNSKSEGVYSLFANTNTILGSITP